MTGISQNIEVSEQIATQNIEFSPTWQLTEEGDIQKKGIISPSQTLTAKLDSSIYGAVCPNSQAGNSI